MPKFQDLTGRRFGKLVVVRRMDDYVSPKGYHGATWECICDCGKTVVVRACNLRSGASQSCGCNRVEKPNRTTHGGSNSRLYNIWCSMKLRCNNKNCVNFADYGGRGIKICDMWSESFVNFQEWATTNGYSDDLSIDRIDNDGNYCPENCRWASNTAQQNNKRNNHLITYQGKTLTMAQWSKETGIKYSKIKGRLNRCGWSVDKALTTP